MRHRLVIMFQERQDTQGQPWEFDKRARFLVAPSLSLHLLVLIHRASEGAALPKGKPSLSFDLCFVFSLYMCFSLLCFLIFWSFGWKGWFCDPIRWFELLLWLWLWLCCFFVFFLFFWIGSVYSFCFIMWSGFPGVRSVHFYGSGALDWGIRVLFVRYFCSVFGSC